MATARADTTTATEDISPAPHVFTVDDYYKMGEAGIFDEDSRVELIDGVVYDMPPIGPEHAGLVDELGHGLRDTLGHNLIVRRQAPLHIGDRSDPEPDLTLLRYRKNYYKSTHPTPDDVLLVIEVADSSLSHDGNTKANAYARAGIREYWIVDLVHDELIVYRDPIRGEYGSMQRLSREDMVTPLAFPDSTIAVTDVLGSPA
jgi:Uma2 family endonuclease